MLGMASTTKKICDLQRLTNAIDLKKKFAVRVNFINMLCKRIKIMAAQFTIRLCSVILNAHLNLTRHLMTVWAGLKFVCNASILRICKQNGHMIDLHALPK